MDIMDMQHKLIYIWVFLALHFVISTTGQLTACQDGWLSFRGSCYYFGHDAVHFTEAEHFCRQHANSHLINVQTKLENDFIKDRLREFSPKNWWIGLTDELIEGTWQWYGTNTVTNFTDWYPGQPDAYPEDCAVYYAGYRFAWGDISCKSLLHPICETRGSNCVDSEMFG